jgi:hypothetical protein
VAVAFPALENRLTRDCPIFSDYVIYFGMPQEQQTEDRNTQVSESFAPSRKKPLRSIRQDCQIGLPEKPRSGKKDIVVRRALAVELWKNLCGRLAIIEPNGLRGEFFCMVSLRKGGRRQVAWASLLPLPVEEDLDVLGDLLYGLPTGPVVPMVNQFIFERSPEAFHRGVIPAISLAAHGGHHAKLLQ